MSLGLRIFLPFAGFFVFTGWGYFWKAFQTGETFVSGSGTGWTCGAVAGLVMTEDRQDRQDRQIAGSRSSSSEISTMPSSAA